MLHRHIFDRFTLQERGDREDRGDGDNTNREDRHGHEHLHEGEGATLDLPDRPAWNEDGGDRPGVVGLAQGHTDHSVITAPV